MQPVCKFQLSSSLRTADFDATGNHPILTQNISCGRLLDIVGSVGLKEDAWHVICGGVLAKKTLWPVSDNDDCFHTKTKRLVIASLNSNLLVLISVLLFLRFHKHL